MYIKIKREFSNVIPLYIMYYSRENSVKFISARKRISYKKIDLTP